MDEVICGGSKDPMTKREATSDRWTKQARETFLATLADSCDVALAEQAAGKGRCSAYSLRRRDPVFAQLWDDALAIAYHKLETALLRRALMGVNAVEIEATPPRGGVELARAASPEVTSGIAAPATTSEMGAALAVLNRHRAPAEARKPPVGHLARETDADTDAALAKQLDALARRLRAGQ